MDSTLPIPVRSWAFHLISSGTAASGEPEGAALGDPAADDTLGAVDVTGVAAVPDAPGLGGAVVAASDAQAVVMSAIATMSPALVRIGLP
jgi:hypothetical protein